MKVKLVPFKTAILVMAISLAGCAHHYTTSDNVAQPEQSLQQTQPCCDGFSELNFKKLRARFKTNLIIDEADPVIELSTGGKSYAEALLLPENNGTTLLQVDSIIKQSLPHVPSKVFYPIITLLDANHQPLETLDRLPFKYSGGLGLWRKLRIVATIDERYRNAKYALIHTSKEKLNQGISTQKPVSVIRHDGFHSMIYGSTTKSRKQVLFSDKGKIQVLAYPL